MTGSNVVWSFKKRLLFCFIGAACAHFLGGCGGSGCHIISRTSPIEVTLESGDAYTLHFADGTVGGDGNLYDRVIADPTASLEFLIRLGIGTIPSPTTPHTDPQYVNYRWKVTPDTSAAVPTIHIFFEDRTDGAEISIEMWRTGDLVYFKVDSGVGTINPARRTYVTAMATILEEHRPLINPKVRQIVAQTTGGYAELNLWKP